MEKIQEFKCKGGKDGEKCPNNVIYIAQIIDGAAFITLDNLPKKDTLYLTCLSGHCHGYVVIV